MNENDVRRLQVDATKEALDAKQTFEIAEQTRKVQSLADQIHQRVLRLTDLASDVRYAVTRAESQPVNYPAGAFHHDTRTIDRLLENLSRESAMLDTLRTAKATTDEMTARYEQRIDEMTSAASVELDGQMPEVPAARVFAMPGGEPAPDSGLYL